MRPLPPSPVRERHAISPERGLRVASLKRWLWPFTLLAIAALTCAAWLAWGRSNAQHPLAWLNVQGQFSAPSGVLTLWASPLLHLHRDHFAFNVAVLLVLGAVGAQLRTPARGALAALLAWPLGTALLIVWPGGPQWVIGLSGLNHALATIVGWHGVASPGLARPERLGAALLLVGVGAKLAVERSWVAPVRSDSVWGFDVAVSAHFTGVLGAALSLLVVGAVCYGLSRRGSCAPKP